MKPRAGAFMLVMNHHVERDQESLRFSLESDAAYVGVLGPRSRYEKLLAGLAAQGYTPDASKTARVHSPLGLSLGAETPDEVAVSILGEILAIRRGFEGGFLSGSGAAFTVPKTDGPGQFVVLGRIDIHEEIGGNRRTRVRSTCRCSTERAPCWSGASSGKNSRSNRCGGAMISPYRTLTMGGTRSR